MPESNDRMRSQLDGDIDRMTGQLLAFGRVAVEMPHLTPEQHEYIARERKLLRSGITHAQQTGAAEQAARIMFMSRPPEEIERMRVRPLFPWATADADVIGDLIAAANSDATSFDEDDDSREGE